MTECGRYEDIGRQNFMEEVLQLYDLSRETRYCNNHDNDGSGGGGGGCVDVEDNDKQKVSSHCISTSCVPLLYDVVT